MMANSDALQPQLDQRGFTLIEMLIVISIIGMLASVVLVGSGSFRSRGRDARRLADLHQARTALELYFTGKSGYPNVTGWSAMEGAIINANIGVFSLSNDPLNVQTGATYDYAPGNCAGSICLNYVMTATLEDPTNPALDNSPIGTIYGIDCDTPVYCVQF
ncbi:MAG: hypothetical protein A2939_03900 [Parcubacteria group bacterium RIFCSPLOWO2_01_FULL_48_18]|nr:MAG: hypothetical protein A2939_03900 [Parcubacteria group bacterium RIFCSPLOWO2_01_FULL_48_18]